MRRPVRHSYPACTRIIAGLDGDDPSAAPDWIETIRIHQSTTR